MKLGVICHTDSPYLLKRSTSAWSLLLMSRFRLFSKTSSIWSGQRKRVLFSLMSSSAKHIPCSGLRGVSAGAQEGDGLGGPCRGPRWGDSPVTQRSPWPGRQKAGRVTPRFHRWAAVKKGPRSHHENVGRRLEAQV